MYFDKVELDNEESYLIFKMGEVYYANPIEFFEEYHIKSKTIAYGELFSMIVQKEGVDLEFESIASYSLKEARRWWAQYLKNIKKVPIPIEIKQLLNSKKKKQQEKLLRGFKLTALELLSYIFYAFEAENYSYSQYEGEHDPIGTNPDSKPNLIHLDKGAIKKFGETSYSDGELKQIITQRKKTTGRILDRENEWHCFFITYSSIRGEEGWKNGQTHFHYLSDKFGLSREYVISQIRSRKYNLGNLPHIEFNFISANND